MIALLLAAVALAGPWAPAPGHGYAKAWVTGLPGIGYTGPDGRIPHGTYLQATASAYGEIGVLPRTALTLHTDLLRVIVADDRVRTRAWAAPGDPQLGVRVQAIQAGRWAAAIEVAGRAPLASDAVKARVRDADGVPVAAVRLGAGVWEASAFASVGLGTSTWYAAGGAGWLVRTSGFRDALLASFEAGRPFGDRWAARARLVAHVAMGPTSVIVQDNTTGSGNGATWSGWSVEGDRRLDEHLVLGASLEGGFYVQRLEVGPVLSVYLGATW